VYPIEHITVDASEGASDKFKVTKSGSDLEIKIGDPNKTTSGRHVYTIGYRVRGALNHFADHDELYWNAIGTEWGVPIAQDSIRVTGPAAIQQVACFGGQHGSSLSCAESSFDGSTATFAQPSLGAYEGVTVVVGIPPGVIVPAPTPILQERWAIQRAFSVTRYTLGISAILMVLLLYGLLRLLWRTGRDRRAIGSPVDVSYGTSTEGEQAVPLFEHGVNPVEYAPPDGMRPGQIGTLLDEVANPLDVTATIVDLAVRGYLRIEEIPKTWFLGKPDWRLVKLKEPDDGLLTYERLLLNDLFKDPDDEDDPVGEAGATPDRPDQTDAADAYQAVVNRSLAPALATVRLSKLKKHFAPELKAVEDALYADVAKRKWFSGRPDKVRELWKGRGWLLFGVAIVAMWLVAWKTHFGLITVPFAFAGIILIRAGRHMPRRTAKGTGLVRRVLGFRTYIATAEVQESKFAEKENLFYQYLPYAIVFDLVEKWAKAFAGLDQEISQATWYVGSRPFTVNALTSSISHFSTTTVGTIVATPGSSGSSGFGGGGFSGGGGGGGGGGSW
jgi:hypothetical protein